MRIKLIFSLMLLLVFKCLKAQVCNNEIDLNNTNVCGLYGDANGNSYWNWELSDPLDPNYCKNWYARTAPSGYLVRMGSPFVNATSGKLKIIADEQDYTKAKGWELLQRKFGCQTDVANPYFLLYNRYTGMLRAYVFLPAQSTSNYQQLLMTIKSVYDIRPATIADAKSIMQAPDKYLNNQAGIAASEVIVSLGESVGNNNWAVAEFYMMLDDNITNTAYSNASLEISIYGVTSSNLYAQIKGTSITSSSPIQNAVFKTENANPGGSSFNFTAKGESLINLGKSMSDFVDAIHKNAEKVAQSLKPSSDPFLQGIGNKAQEVADKTASSSDFYQVLNTASGLLGEAGQILKFAGSVLGFFKSSSGGSASPSYSTYNLIASGTLTSQVVVQKFVIKIPGTSELATNTNNATYFNHALGIFNLKVTPFLDTLAYDRRALLPSYDDGSGFISTIRYTAYKLHDNVQVVLNAGTGLSLVSIEGALLAKVVTNPLNAPSGQIYIGPLENYPKRGYHTYFNHMRADVEANRLELTDYDADGGVYHTIQTPYYPLECLKRASMNIHVPVMKIFLRLRAILRRTDGQGDFIYFIKDYEIDKHQGKLADIPLNISTDINAIPPYANYIIPPNTSSSIDWQGNVTGESQDIRIACNNCPGYSGNTTFTNGGEIRVNHTISTSTNYYSDTYSDNYTTISNSSLLTFRAGAYILFRPKFLVTNGSVFLATTDWGYTSIPCYLNRLVSSYYFPGNSYNSDIVVQKTDRINFIPREISVSEKKNVYPNPTSEKINIPITSSEKITKVQIIDGIGMGMNISFVYIGCENIQIDVSKLSSGEYTVVVNTNMNIKSYRFVKVN